jgi:hypothetical protein
MHMSPLTYWNLYRYRCAKWSERGFAIAQLCGVELHTGRAAFSLQHAWARSRAKIVIDTLKGANEALQSLSCVELSFE